LTTVVRRAREEDAAWILETLRDAFEPYRERYTAGGFADTVLTPAALAARMAEMSVFVATGEDGAVVGTIGVATHGREAHLRGMAIRPATQRHGVGQRLLRRALDEASLAGCSRVTLDTTAPLEGAMRFYEAAGFARTGRVQDFFGMPLFEYARALDHPFSIREATPADVPALLRVINAAYLVEREFVEGDRLSEKDLRRMFGQGTFLVAARAGGEAIANVFLQRTAPDRMYLGLLAVDPAEQRHGLGRLMMAAAERYCRDAGCAAIDIRIVLRTELPPFYLSLGFVPNGTAPFEDPRLFKPAHFLVMTLPLDTEAAQT
jgi:GNAT superfamily N-acetyltransferase